MPEPTRPEAVIGPTAAPLRIVAPSEHGIGERARLIVRDHRSGEAVLNQMIDAGGSHAVAPGALSRDGEYRFKLQLWRGTRWSDALLYQALVPKAAAAPAHARATRPAPAPLPDAACGAPVRVVKSSELGVDEAALRVVYHLRTDKGVLRADIGGVELDVGEYAIHGELPAHCRSFLRREVHRILHAQGVASA